MEYLRHTYDEFLANADPRVADLPFMGSSLPNLFSVILYLFIVKFAGPAFMKNREPFQLQSFLFVYNMILVVFSAWMFYEFLASGWWNDYSLECEECDYSVTPRNMRMVRVCWWYWMSKHVEFCDTYFFILKKKWNQLSTLHVTHHTLMAITWWYGVKYSAGGLGTFHALLNCLVHTFMYLYYGIAALGPEYRRYIFWKKYLTTFQMVQFIVVVSHMLNIIIRHPNCVYPAMFKLMILSYGVLFYYLFSNFWTSAYNKAAAGDAPIYLKKKV